MSDFIYFFRQSLNRKKNLAIKSELNLKIPYLQGLLVVANDYVNVVQSLGSFVLK